jgi:hypothetical protein
MIESKKRMHPGFGMALAFLIIIGGLFGPLDWFSNMGPTTFLLWILPSITIGMTLLVLNSQFLGLMMLAKRLDKGLSSMHPIIYVTNMCIIVKIEEFYLVRWQDKFLHILRFNAKQPVEVSKARNFIGPKLPSIFPLKFPQVAEFLGYTIRKGESLLKLYDPAEKRWFQGEGDIFSIHLGYRSILPLITENNLYQLISMLRSY